GGIELTVRRRYQTGQRINLLTAHKAKGLEYDTVFVIDAMDKTWGKGTRVADKLPFPSNLPLAMDDSEDEQIRLLYVAMTRAARRLYLVGYGEDDAGTVLLPIRYLAGADMDEKIIAFDGFRDNLADHVKLEMTNEWDDRLVQVDADLRSLLAPVLDEYKLNATAVNSFINLEYAGPDKFLLGQLLRFPSAKTPNAEFGSAMHETLKYAHSYHVKNDSAIPIGAAQKFFEQNLADRHLSASEHARFLGRGMSALKAYLGFMKFDAGQKAEVNFNSQNVTIDGVPLKGIIDLMEIDVNKRQIIVYDYKTGGSYDRFDRASKPHCHKQQLLFYKLLIENSRDFRGFTVTRGILHFVEPQDGQIKSIEVNFSDKRVVDDLLRFRKLIMAIYGRIMNLNFDYQRPTNPEKVGIREILTLETELLDEL
ncbi:MAG: PD-(D/E)XK nuclease family protein, partial [Candidatus Nomurabacteria bacterium]|nr:PD-(D/E)XK nuclease family protein [Candidatus Nomurabacteria bacterium]